MNTITIKDHNIYKDLIKLSTIFKDGFTIEINNNSINQYSNRSKPYIVSYKTLIEIKNNKVKFYSGNIPNKSIIGGWLDIEKNIYYIELNQAFYELPQALLFAKKHKQRYIYNMNTNNSIKVL